MKTNKIETWLIGLIFAAFVAGTLFALHQAFEKDDEIESFLEPSVQETEKVESFPYREAYLITAKKLAEAEEQLKEASQVIQDQEQLVHMLAEETDEQAFKRAEIKKLISQSVMAFNNRVNPTLAQRNQMKSWLMSKGRVPPVSDYHAFLEKEVFTPEQFAEYLEYEQDLRYSRRLRTMADLMQLIDLSDEKLDAFYNHGFSSDGEALAEILNPEERALWDHYNKQ